VKSAMKPAPLVALVYGNTPIGPSVPAKNERTRYGLKGNIVGISSICRNAYMYISYNDIRI